MTDEGNRVCGGAGGVLGVYDFSHRGHKSWEWASPYLGHTPVSSHCLAPMLWFISCSYRVDLGGEPED